MQNILHHHLNIENVYIYNFSYFSIYIFIYIIKFPIKQTIFYLRPFTLKISNIRIRGYLDNEYLRLSIVEGTVAEGKIG